MGVFLILVVVVYRLDKLPSVENGWFASKISKLN